MREDVPTRPANHSPEEAEDSSNELWLVSYADDDDREMRPDEIFRAIRRGEIDGETIVWREGMVEWQAIADTPELQSELEKIASQAGGKRTVMGGFGSGAPKPMPPRPNGGQGGLPRNTLIGTGAQLLDGGPPPSPRVAIQGRSDAPGDADDGDTAITAPLDSESTLESGLLEAVPDSVGPAHVPSQTETAPLPDVRRSDDPGAYGDPGSYERQDEQPISLNPDSIESLPSDALESVVAQLPPTDAPSAPRGIFEIDSMPAPPPEDEEKANQTAPMPGPKPPPGPPHPPLRSRVSDDPLQLSRAPSIDPGPLVEEEEKSGSGKVFLMVLLFAAMGVAMFYVGRQTATTPPATQTTPSAASSPTEPSASAAPTAAATTTTEATAEAAEPSEEGEPEEEAEPAEETDEAQPSPQKSVHTSPHPRPTPRATPSPQPAPKPAVKPSPSPAPAEEPAALAPFNPAAARSALERAAAAASTCRKADDPSGVASVTVTFVPSGRATSARISGPPFAGTTTGGCIAAKMRTAKVPPFSGDRMTVKKVVVIR